MKILSMDIGKFKSVFLIYDTALPAAQKQERFGKIPTTATDVHDLLAEHQPDRLVVEVGNAAGWISDLAGAMGIEVQVANTNDERWQWKRAKKKTDRMDALKLAQMSEMESLPTVHVPEARVRQWRSLIEYRGTLVQRQTAVKNSIRAIFDRQGLVMISGKSQWTVAGIAELAKLACPMKDCAPEQLWRGQLQMELEQLSQMAQLIAAAEVKLGELAKADARVKLLQTAPGVGPRLSEAVVAVLDDPHRFQNARQVGAYVGLTPRQWQSGQSMRDGHISRCGNPTLRALLIEVAWLGVWRGTWMKQAYEQVRRGSPKRKKIAIVAVARRLIIRLWAMLKKGQPWQEAMEPAASGA